MQLLTINSIDESTMSQHFNKLGFDRMDEDDEPEDRHGRNYRNKNDSGDDEDDEDNLRTPGKGAQEKMSGVEDAMFELG